MAYENVETLLPVGAAARYKGVGEQQIRGACASGKLPYTRIGSRGDRRISTSALDAWDGSR